MKIDEALELSDEWIKGVTLYEGAQGWRVACHVLATEVRRLRQDCAEAYQVVGSMIVGTEFNSDDVARYMDNLSAAASGLPRPHDDLLPWPKGEK